MEQIESERDQHKDRCTQLENQLEISQKIVDTQQLSLDAKEVGLICLLHLYEAGLLKKYYWNYFSLRLILIVAFCLLWMRSKNYKSG